MPIVGFNFDKLYVEKMKPIEPPSMKARTQASTIMHNLQFMWENVGRWGNWANLEHADVPNEKLNQQRRMLLYHKLGLLCQ